MENEMENLNAFKVETTLPLKDLKGIADQIRNSTNEAANDSWSDAAFTCSWSVGPSGGNLQGWITYYDGKKIHFELRDVQSKTGTAAGAAAIPWIRVLDWSEMPGEGTFDLSGFGLLGAKLHLNANGRSITNPADISTTSAGPWDFKLKGSIQYEKSS